MGPAKRGGLSEWYLRPSLTHVWCGGAQHARLDLEQAQRVAVAEAAERGEELGDIPLLTEALEGLAAKEAEGK